MRQNVAILIISLILAISLSRGLYVSLEARSDDAAPKIDLKHLSTPAVTGDSDTEGTF